MATLALLKEKFPDLATIEFPDFATHALSNVTELPDFVKREVPDVAMAEIQPVPQQVVPDTSTPKILRIGRDFPDGIHRHVQRRGLSGRIGRRFEEIRRRFKEIGRRFKEIGRRRISSLRPVVLTSGPPRATWVMAIMRCASDHPVDIRNPWASPPVTNGHRHGNFCGLMLRRVTPECYGQVR